MRGDVKPMERAVVLTRCFVLGGVLTARQAAEMTGVSLRTAQRDLALMSGVLEIWRDECGVWRGLSLTRQERRPMGDGWGLVNSKQ